MHEADTRLLEESFKRYYFDHFDRIRVPDSPAMREFGYQRFNSGMIRHIGAKDDRELRLLIMQNTPSDIYCSNGYYSFPNLPMSEKDWQGADLIFDIDAKDLDLPCRVGHTCRRCASCGRVFQSESCPHCASARYESRSLPCMNCIGAARREVDKLSTILTEDLGIDAGSIRVYFSGNEGFHVYVHDERYQKLGSRERAEISDYIMFRGAVPETFGMRRHNPDRSVFASLDEGGWRGRVAREVFGSKSRRPGAIRQVIKDGYQQFAGRLEQLSRTIGAMIDSNVTTDIHRVFRLAGSLNSKSGLAKTLCEPDGFSPYRDACLIDDDKVEVRADVPCRFVLGGRRFGPYDGGTFSVPRFAAVYMICKGLASAALK